VIESVTLHLFVNSIFYFQSISRMIFLLQFHFIWNETFQDGQKIISRIRSCISRICCFFIYKLDFTSLFELQAYPETF